MATEEPQSGRDAQVARLLRTAATTERAPAGLHARVDQLQVGAGGKRGLQPGLRGVVPRYVGLAAGVAAVLTTALALTLGGAGAPSIAQAAMLAARGPVASAPRPDPQAPGRLLAAHVGALQFPSWQQQGGWKAVGTRTDQVGDRAVTTVYYSDGRSRIAYSIVSAPALGGLKTGAEPYATIRPNGRTAVVWEEQNHTCILSSTDVSASELWGLASS